MKKWILSAVILTAMPLSMLAQDDMYFVPSKAKAKVSREMPVSRDTYYAGSNRDIDEYNRMGGSSYEPLSPDTGDIITFAPVEGVYPDSVQDYSLTRKMARWDGYEPSAEYWEGYSKGQRDARSWHSPWYYSSYYPWYDSWYYNPWYYDPWYYSSWYWYDPWYYSGRGWGWRGYWNRWYDPWYYGGYWGGGGYAHNWSRGSGSYRSIPHGSGTSRYGNGGVAGTHRGTRFGTSTAGSRASSTMGTRRTTVGTTTAGSTRSRTSSRVSGSSSGTYDAGPRSSGSRSSSGSTYTPSSSGSMGGGSFGGSRSGGGSFGGGSRGGGGTSGSSRR